MTTLRFVGDLPVWWGLLLSVCVCWLSWNYYSRESFDLPRRLRWFLPLLRSTAFFLGIMMLTSPVLHHRKTIGELGRVKIYLDESASMTLRDKHLPLGRKLFIAEQLGWLTRGTVDVSSIQLTEDLTQARQEFQRELQILSRDWVRNQSEIASSADREQVLTVELHTLTQKFQTHLLAVQSRIPANLNQQFDDQLMKPLKALEPITTIEQSTFAKLQELAEGCNRLGDLIQQWSERLLSEKLNSQHESLVSTLSLFDETPRWRRVHLALAESSANVLSKLQEAHHVELFSLSGQTTSPHPLLLPQLRPEDSSAEPIFSTTTDLSSGIVVNQNRVADSAFADQKSSAESAPPQTAIVLITDGNHNAGPSPLQTARVLGSQGMPYFCVAIGASEPARDLAVRKLESPQIVFKKDRVRGAIYVNDTMPAGIPFVAQVRRGNDLLWQQQLLTQNSGERRIEFEFGVDQLVPQLTEQSPTDVKWNAIPLTFEAEILPLPEEAEVANNTRSMQLAVITQSHKALLLDGRSRWETRYLRNLFERDAQWKLDTVIAGTGTDNPALPRGDRDNQFPATRNALFEYDLILFGELGTELFSQQELIWLRDFVEIRGGGIIFVDGQRQLLRRFRETELGSLIPVEWLPTVLSTKPTSLQLTAKGASESFLKLQGEEQQNSRFWTELPPPHNIVAVSALPGAEVLVEANMQDQQFPVMVTQQFGAGRVLYHAFDESWRWRYKSADLWHQRIWNQLAKFVMPRPFSISDEYLSLDTGAVSYDFGSSVEIRARLIGLDGKPSTASTVEALLWKDGELMSTIPLDGDAELPGLYRGRSSALPEGKFEVSIRASGYSDAVLKARSQFEVHPAASDEMSLTAANEQLLRQMSEETGGVYLREESIHRLPELLNPLSRGRVVESETVIWQSYWWFAMIMLLLATEWILRKRAGLL